MRPVYSGLLIFSVLFAPMSNSAALENNALYQWNTKNGTPTYSPDPPPKGVEYVVVGPDLKPLATQPAPPGETELGTEDSIIASDSTSAPTATGTTPARKWKPVRYANAPAGNAQVIIKTKAVTQPAVTAEIAASAVLESNECQVIKRERMILESQFSRAKTDSEMDNTILQLHAKSMEYGEKCR